MQKKKEKFRSTLPRKSTWTILFCSVLFVWHAQERSFDSLFPVDRRSGPPRCRGCGRHMELGITAFWWIFHDKLWRNMPTVLNLHSCNYYIFLLERLIEYIVCRCERERVPYGYERCHTPTCSVDVVRRRSINRFIAFLLPRFLLRRLFIRLSCYILISTIRYDILLWQEIASRVKEWSARVNAKLGWRRFLVLFAITLMAGAHLSGQVSKYTSMIQWHSSFI